MASIPLKLLSGFSEDIQKLIVNMRQELIMIPNSNDKETVISIDNSVSPKIDIKRLIWCVHHVAPSLKNNSDKKKLFRKV